jgi:HEAT repeat protein
MIAVRILRETLRGLAVIALAAVVSPCFAEGERPVADSWKDVRSVVRTDLPVEERVAAARRLLEGPPLGRDLAEAALHAAPSLAKDAPEESLRLLVLAVDARPFLGAARDQAAKGFLEARGEDVWTAAAMLVLRTSLPDRPEVYRAIPSWPAEGVLADVLRREVSPPLDSPKPDPTTWDRDTLVGALVAQISARTAMATAEEQDPATARGGLDALVEGKGNALPLLLHEAAMAAQGVPEGRLPRVTRAIAALGLVGDRRATDVLSACMEAPSGWVRVAAATALGDLGDPAAAIVLCRQLLYRGDIFRPREQWEYPGVGETTVSQADWNNVEYYVVDEAAADALLRMGVRNAAGWLIRTKLDPSKGRFRIRALQDSVDALRRSVPTSPWAQFVCDAGIPQRHDAFLALRGWWEAHRFDPSLTKSAFPEDDPGYREKLSALIENLHGKIMELLIAHETIALLGSAATPSLIAALPGATKHLFRVELARALGDVEDLRAVPALLGLLSDDYDKVRSAAAEAAASYVDRTPEFVEPLIKMLDDPRPGPQVSALKTLSAVPPSEVVLQAVRAHPASKHEALVGDEDREYRIAEEVALLLHEGEAHWPAVKEGLKHSDRYVRRQWWDLLRRPLQLHDEVFDPNPDPTAREFREADEKEILTALRARRAK